MIMSACYLQNVYLEVFSKARVNIHLLVAMLAEIIWCWKQNVFSRKTLHWVRC